MIGHWENYEKAAFEPTGNAARIAIAVEDTRFRRWEFCRKYVALMFPFLTISSWSKPWDIPCVEPFLRLPDPQFNRFLRDDGGSGL